MKPISASRFAGRGSLLRQMGTLSLVDWLALIYRSWPPRSDPPCEASDKAVSGWLAGWLCRAAPGESPGCQNAPLTGVALGGHRGDHDARSFTWNKRPRIGWPWRAVKPNRASEMEFTPNRPMGRDSRRLSPGPPATIKARDAHPIPDSMFHVELRCGQRGPSPSRKPPALMAGEAESTDRLIS